MPDGATTIEHDNRALNVARQNMLSALVDFLADRSVPDTVKRSEVTATISAVEQIMALHPIDG